MVYENTLDMPFHFDDYAYLLQSENNKQFNINIDDLLKGVFSPGRSVTRWTFFINHYFHADSVFWYHVFNVIAHGVNGFLLYILMKNLAVKERNNEFSLKNFHFLSFSVALLFVSHPVATHSVTYISQRHVLLSTFFYLLSCLFYISFRQSFGKKKYIPLFLLMLCYWLAIHAKPVAVTAPLMWIVYDLLFHPGGLTDRRRRAIPLAVSLSVFLAVSLLYFIGNDFFQEKVAVAGFNTTNLWDVRQHFFTEAKVFLHYLKIILVPLQRWLCVDHQYPLATQLDYKVAAAFFGHVLIICAAILSYRKGLIVCCFGIVWFYLALVPPYMFVPLADVMVDYKTYLPSIGIFCAVAGLADRFLTKKFAVVAAVGYACVLAAFVWGAKVRNEVFRTEVSFWSDAVEKYPNNTRAYNNRGLAYMRSGEWGKAIEDYRVALAREPENVFLLANAGDAYAGRGENEQALLLYARYQQLNPEKNDGYIRMGNIYARQKQWAEAVHFYKKAEQKAGLDPDLLYNLGLGYSFLGEHQLAIDYFHHLVRLDRTNVKGLSALGAQYALVGQFTRAKKYLDAALQINPSHEDALQNSVVCAQALQEKSEAIRFANKLKEVNAERGASLLEMIGRTPE